MRNELRGELLRGDLCARERRKKARALASPELAQPEAYLQMTKGLVTDDGDVTNEGTSEFLLSWLKAVHTHIAKTLSKAR